MIRVVLDTNVIISGWLWSGSPRQVLNIARERRIQTVISEAILDELRDVLSRPKFVARLNHIGKMVEEILTEYLQFAEIVESAQVKSVIDREPDDDAVLACAIGGKADYIVTGDDHLLALKNFREISIVNVNQFLSIEGISE